MINSRACMVFVIGCLFFHGVQVCPFPAFAEDSKAIQLASPSLDKGKSLMQALKERKTRRDFTPQELPLELLSDLLWAADGVNRPDGRRTAPTASNCQEIDIYVAMKRGLYCYNAEENRLDMVLEKDIRAYTGIQDFVAIAPVVLVFVADFSRMRGDSAQKTFYSAVDTGYISQNVYLFAAQEGLSTVALGWVKKEELGRVMNLRPEQTIILTQPVGYGEGL